VSAAHRGLFGGSLFPMALNAAFDHDVSKDWAALGAGGWFGRSDPVKNDDGKAGNPNFKVAPDGTVDWCAYSGNRRNNSEYEVCHGSDGEGSTFAPSLLDSLKRLSYSDFILSSVTVVKTSIPQIKGDAFVRERPQRDVLS
jgi:hypothetical protein